jgi:N-methylhydantoinase A/oxoprolinase/acetone carboxylase beta subunit
MGGAAYLGLSDFSLAGKKTSTIVVDVGGTTTDVGVLVPSGFPRQASAYVEFAGVKIKFSMRHVESISLGGGSIVRSIDGNNVTVGPDSIGHYLTTKAKVFGGDILTATDIAVAASENIGDRRLIKDLSLSIVELSQDRITALLERVIDQMKTSPEPPPVLLIEGGSAIVPKEIAGVSEVIQPPFHCGQCCWRSYLKSWRYREYHSKYRYVVLSPSRTLLIWLQIGLSVTPSRTNDYTNHRKSQTYSS